MHKRDQDKHMAVESGEVTRELASVYETVYAGDAKEGARVEVQRLEGGEVRDSFGYLLGIALEQCGHNGTAPPEYRITVQLPDAEPQAWEVQGLRELAGWMTPDPHEKEFALRRSLPEPNGYGLDFESATLTLTGQGDSLRVHGIWSYALAPRSA